VRRERPDEPWLRQAARGVGFVVLFAVAIFAAGGLIAGVFALAMG